VSRAVVIATGITVTVTGDREVLGIDVGDSEDGAFWTAFLKGVRARGLTGVQLVISDHPPGRHRGPPRVHQLPHRALAQDLVDEPARADQRRDQTTHQRWAGPVEFGLGCR
jgi:hypothetical protein